jgi:hypothetical protein
MSSDTALKIALKQCELQQPQNGKPYIIIPKSDKLIDMEHMMDRPQKVRQSLSFLDFEDYLKYISVHKQPNTTTFWHKRLLSKSTMLTVIDYHERKDGYNYANWCEHLVAYATTNITDAVEEFKRREKSPIYNAKIKHIHQR